MTRPVPWIVLVWCLVLVAGQARAGIVFDQGSPTGGLGHAISFRPDSDRPRLADDFLLSVDAYITGLTFWTLESGLWNGTLQYYLYADEGGLPSLTAFATGSAANVSREVTGTFTIGTQYRNSFEFESAVHLDANTVYWLGLFMESESPSDAIFWETTSQGFGSKVVRSEFSAGVPVWNPIGIDGVDQMAFQISGVEVTAVPEPSTLALCLAGAVALAGYRRRFNRPCSRP